MVMLSRLGISTDWSSMDLFFADSCPFFQESAIFELFESFLLFDFESTAAWKDAALFYSMSWGFYGKVFDAWFDVIDSRIYFSYHIPVADLTGYEDDLLWMTLALTTDLWLTPQIFRFGMWAIYFLRSLPVSHSEDDTVSFFYEMFDHIITQWSFTHCPLSTKAASFKL